MGNRIAEVSRNHIELFKRRIDDIDNKRVEWFTYPEGRKTNSTAEERALYVELIDHHTDVIESLGETVESAG